MPSDLKLAQTRQVLRWFQIVRDVVDAVFIGQFQFHPDGLVTWWPRPSRPTLSSFRGWWVPFSPRKLFLFEIRGLIEVQQVTFWYFLVVSRQHLIGWRWRQGCSTAGQRHDAIYWLKKEPGANRRRAPHDVTVPRAVGGGGPRVKPRRHFVTQSDERCRLRQPKRGTDVWWRMSCGAAKRRPPPPPPVTVRPSSAVLPPSPSSPARNKVHVTWFAPCALCSVEPSHILCCFHKILC